MLSIIDHGNGETAIWEKSPVEAMGTLRLRVVRVALPSVAPFFEVRSADRAIKLYEAESQDDALRWAGNYLGTHHTVLRVGEIDGD